MATYRSITALKDSIAPTGLGANYSTQGKLSTFPFLVNGKTIETSIEIDSSGGRNNVSLVGPDGQTLAYYDKTSNKWSAPGSQGNLTITPIIIDKIKNTSGLLNALNQSAYFTALNANGGNSTQATQLTGIKPSTPTPTVAPPAGGLNPNSPGNQPTGDILFDLLDPDKLPFKFGDVDDVIRKMPLLNYPEDALYNKTQDHLSISQYSYKPPRSNDIFGDALDTLKTGSKRTSPLKELLGMVNLPMPNNITDSNNVSWGDDNMNNLSAALTSYVAKNAMLTGAGALALNAGASAAGVGGGAAQTASLIAALKKMEALDPNNQTEEMKT